jgi:hypothetical protein
MTEKADKYWDELGVAWRAIELDAEVIGPRLQSRLRRQSLLIRSAIVAGVPFGAFGILLGVMTIRLAWVTGAWYFIARGTAIGIIAALLLTTSLALVGVRGDANARSLAEMLDLAIRRARKSLLVIRLSLLSCAIAAAFGIAGAIFRARAGRPPTLSPVVDVAILVLVAVSLLVYRQRATASLSKLRYLEQLVASDPSKGRGRP